ncbi:DnaJ domain-containing protein [bacterium]|nr:DnaJ domain-containing protein [bacterium]
MKKLITFKDIDNARKVLDVPDVVSIEDIKEKHRKLIFEYHPDRYQNSKDMAKYKEKIKEINNSYKIIMNYRNRYPVSFGKEKVKLYRPEAPLFWDCIHYQLTDL